MKKFVKTSLKILSVILAAVLTAPALVLSAIQTYSLGVRAISISFLAFLVIGALLGLFIGYRILLGRKTKVMEENAALSTRLKLSWENNSFLQDKIAKLKNTLREYENLIRDVDKTEHKHKKEVADLEQVLINYIEKNGKLEFEVSRLKSKLEAETAARTEAAARSGKKELHLDTLRERHIEHLQKARAQKKELAKRVEMLEDELGLLRMIADEYWTMKKMYEPKSIERVSVKIDSPKLLSPVGLLKEAV